MQLKSTQYMKTKPSFIALTPLFLFFALYLVVSIVVGDFYKMPIVVAFVASSAVAIAMCSGYKYEQRIGLFSRGASDKNIMLMIWIFVLAGAFAASAKAMGAVDASVNLTLSLLPDEAPRPLRYSAPGSPISSQLLISEA